jgi:hypothetical protein
VLTKWAVLIVSGFVLDSLLDIESERALDCAGSNRLNTLRAAPSRAFATYSGNSSTSNTSFTGDMMTFGGLKTSSSTSLSKFGLI